MDISSLNTPAVWSSQQVASASSITGASSTGDTGAVDHPHGHHHHGGGGGMVDQILQALNQSGVTTDASGSTNSSQQGQALQQFMSTLFQTLQSGQTQADPSQTAGTTAAAGASPYTSMETTLQGLVTSLNAGGTSASSGPIGTLQTEFQNLVAASGGSAGADPSTAGGSSPNLQNFLSTLLQSMQAHQPGSTASGTTLSTTA